MVWLLENWTTVLMIGIVTVVAASQFDRILGASFGIVFWVSMGVLGHFAYASGRWIGFLSEPFYLAMCAGMIGIQLFMIRNERARRARAAALREQRL